MAETDPEDIEALEIVMGVIEDLQREMAWTRKQLQRIEDEEFGDPDLMEVED